MCLDPRASVPLMKRLNPKSQGDHLEHKSSEIPPLWCQDVVSRAWAADEMSTVSFSQQHQHSDTVVVVPGQRGCVSPAERSAWRLSAHSQACARTGRGGVPSTSHRGP